MPRKRAHIAARSIAVLALSGLLLSACASGTEETRAGAESDDGFPITIDHALGETRIDQKPERVVAVGGWPNAEAALALGVVPVAMPRADYGDDDGDGVLPWTQERLAELGGETPVLLDETDGIDFEAVADAAPDVVLAATSGLTEEEYETLSKIAPVVAYPGIAWGTTWRDNILLSSEALGLSDEGKNLVAQLEEEIGGAAAAHPELAGTSAAFVNVSPSDTSSIGVATTLDARASYLNDLGLEAPQLVAERSESADAFFFDLSAEQVDQLGDADILLGYGGEGTELGEVLRSDQLLRLLPAVENGAVVSISDGTPLAAALTPSPLGIPWSIDELASELAAAAARAQ